MTTEDDVPTLITGRKVFGWHLVEGLGESTAGSAMLREAVRILMSVQDKVEEVMPGHQIDKSSLVLEIGVQYLVPADES